MTNGKQKKGYNKSFQQQTFKVEQINNHTILLRIVRGDCQIESFTSCKFAQFGPIHFIGMFLGMFGFNQSGNYP